MHRTIRDKRVAAEVEKEGMDDPFDAEESDPTRTNAIESSLWEIETLQSHYHPNVAAIARIISEQFTKQAYNLEDFLDHTYVTVSRTEYLGFLPPIVYRCRCLLIFIISSLTLLVWSASFSILPTHFPR